LRRRLVDLCGVDLQQSDVLRPENVRDLAGAFVFAGVDASHFHNALVRASLRWHVCMSQMGAGTHR